MCAAEVQHERVCNELQHEPVCNELQLEPVRNQVQHERVCTAVRSGLCAGSRVFALRAAGPLNLTSARSSG